MKYSSGKYTARSSQPASFWFIGECLRYRFPHAAPCNQRWPSSRTIPQKKEPGGCSRIAGNFKYSPWRVSKVSGRITRASAHAYARHASESARGSADSSRFPSTRRSESLSSAETFVSRRDGRRSKSRVTRPSTLFARHDFRESPCETGSAEAFEVSNRPWFHSMNHFRDVSRRVNADS